MNARVRCLLVACVVAGLVNAVEARRWQSTGISKPGLGVSGIGVSTVFVPAPGVSTPTVHASNVTTPMVTGTPGVTSRNVTTPMTTGLPGAAAPGVSTQAVVGSPGVATSAAPVNGLPRGYYTSIPGDAVQKLHRGEMCYYSGGIYYRAEFYMGSLVYVVVP
jgi:hypothetical protein